MKRQTRYRVSKGYRGPSRLVQIDAGAALLLYTVGWLGRVGVR